MDSQTTIIETALSFSSQIVQAALLVATAFFAASAKVFKNVETEYSKVETGEGVLARRISSTLAAIAGKDRDRMIIAYWVTTTAGILCTAGTGLLYITETTFGLAFVCIAAGLVVLSATAFTFSVFSYKKAIRDIARLKWEISDERIRDEERKRISTTLRDLNDSISKDGERSTAIALYAISGKCAGNPVKFLQKSK